MPQSSGTRSCQGHPTGTRISTCQLLGPEIGPPVARSSGGRMDSPVARLCLPLENSRPVAPGQADPVWSGCFKWANMTIIRLTD